MTTRGATPAISDRRWRIDPKRSRVEFQSKTFWGMMTVTGTFDRYDATMELAAEPAISMIVEADSLDTGNSMRDKHLRSGDFFDVENSPNVRFISDEVALDGEQLTAHGVLHAAGCSVALSIEGTVVLEGETLSVEASAEVDHRQLGMSRGLLAMVRPPSRLRIRAQAGRDGLPS
jgi:polyisoprenoid-binding protein YceI